MTRLGYASSRLRRGITILEVLIAAGVLAIGMFGVMAMIPLIAMRLREGEIADRSAVLSRNAVEEFQVRGWTDPTRWRWYRADGTYVNPNSPPPGASLPISPAICVDPQGVAGILGANTLRARFPVNPLNGDNRYLMQRVTPFSLVNQGSPNNLTDQGIAEVGAVAEDDLLFERPKSRTELPTQTFPSIASNTPADQTRRMAQRDYSYMATLTPLDNVMAFGGRGNYLLSAIVFYQRSRTYEDEYVGSISPTVTNNALGDPISGFPSGGISGGDVVINCGAGGAMVNLAKGDWVMLTYPRQLDGSGNVLQPAYHRWYQVIEATPYNPADLDGSGNSLRRVTLAGPDWPGVGATMADPTQVTWLPGVASVSEKTISLNANGTWE